MHKFHEFCTLLEGEIIVEKPPVDPSIQMNTMTKEEQQHIYEESRNVFGFYNQKCIEALQKTTRISLDILRQRTGYYLNMRNIKN